MSELNEKLTKELSLCARFLRQRPMGQQHILKVLMEKEPISQKDLQNEIAVRPGSISEMMAKLEGQGLIEKQRSSTDGRAFDISLTEKGREQLESMDDDNLYSILTEEEKQQLYEILYKLNNDWIRRGPVDRMGPMEPPREMGPHHPGMPKPFGYSDHQAPPPHFPRERPQFRNMPHRFENNNQEPADEDKEQRFNRFDDEDKYRTI